MRYLIFVILCGWMASCTVTKPTTTFVLEKEVQHVMDSVATQDTSAAVVVYNVNVIAPKPEQKGMSNENRRLLITKAGDLVATLMALIIVDQSSNP